MVKYTYTGNKLVDESGRSVMMDWERPVMKKVSDLLCFNNGDVLNIGFGMGIVDSYIREHNPKSHTIIESHPDVIKHIKETEWDKKCNFVFGRWQEQISKITTFDSIYLDTWDDNRVPYINELLEKCLKVGGIFSMWYNQQEFESVINNLPENYSVSYEYVENNNIIPPSKEQFENGGFYIDPNSENIIIPIITKK
jgi:spermidine synthase